MSDNINELQEECGRWVGKAAVGTDSNRLDNAREAINIAIKAYDEEEYAAAVRKLAQAENILMDMEDNDIWGDEVYDYKQRIYNGGSHLRNLEVENTIQAISKFKSIAEDKQDVYYS